MQRWAKIVSRVRLWLCAGLLGIACSNALAQVNPFPGQAKRLPGLVMLTDHSTGASYFDPLVRFPSGGMFPDLSHPTAEGVIRFNACGREIDYALIRDMMADASLGDQEYSLEGSELTSILIAKIAWLNNKATAGNSCTYTFTLLPGAPPSDEAVTKIKQALSYGHEPCSGITVTTPSHATGSATSLPLNGRSEVTFAVSPICMGQQVNAAIMAMKKVGNLGTTGVPCHAGFSGTNGEWDAKNRELVRILYMGTQTLQASTQYPHAPVLNDPTIQHMEKDGLLAAVGPVGPDTYDIPMFSCNDYAGDQEGDPQDIQDQGDTGNTIKRDLGDALKWFIDLLVKIEIGGELGAITEVLPLGLTPFMIAPSNDPWGSILPNEQLVYQETENHRIQIESTRFLTNAYYIKVQQQSGLDYDTLQSDQEDVAEWLHNRMQSIAFNDFIEYNAHDYTTYSLQSLTNLYDFASDSSIQVGAHVLLDISEAKFAAGSNLGRRVVPFRRHDYEDGYSPPSSDNTCTDAPYLYHGDRCEDQEVLRAMVLSGQTQLVPLKFPDSDCPSVFNTPCVQAAVVPGLVNTELSPYALPGFLHDLIVNRPGALTQHIKHSGVEDYYQEPAFTASVGGLRTPQPYKVLGVPGDPTSRGDAVPTLIIPTMGGVTVADLFSFDGIGTGGDRTENLCLYKGFICGLNPNMSNFLEACHGIAHYPDGTFVVSGNTNGCPIFGSHQLVLAGWAGNCFGGSYCASTHYGFMEAVDCTTDCVAVGTAMLKSVRAVQFDRDGKATYVNHFGEPVHFQISKDRPVILDVSGAALPTDGTTGGVLNSDGAGHITIQSPFSGTRIRIDYTDASNPTWQTTP